METVNGLRIGRFLLVEDFSDDCWELKGSKGEGLGLIEWYQPWRCFVLSPKDGTVFNAECLRDIEKFLHEAQRKNPEA